MQGTNVQPGEALLDKGLVDKLEDIRQQCQAANALALNFRNTFMPVRQLIMDNTFGRACGPLGHVMRQARDAMNTAKSKVDDARTVALRMKRIKNRATNQGLQAGTGGQTLSGYRQDLAATLPPDQVQPKPPTIVFHLLCASRNLPPSKSPGASTIA